MMLGIVLIGSMGFQAAFDEGASSPSRDQLFQAYETKRSAVGRDPDAQVRLALWCEAHGLTAERARHLAMAALTDPNHAIARALMGLVRDGGDWKKPEEVSTKLAEDASVSAVFDEYAERRARTPDTADAHWKLALWCEEQGLTAQARAHLEAVVRLDPSREIAWKRMGYTRQYGRWMTTEQASAVKADAQAQLRANRQWKSKLEQWKRQLDREGRRQDVEEALAKVDDPRSVPSILTVFGTGTETDQRRAVQLLGQINSPRSTWGLALLAVQARSESVRRLATETLIWRDGREYVTGLIARIRKPIRYEVRPVGGPGSPGELFIEGERFDIQRRYHAPAEPAVALQPGDTFGRDENGLPVIYRRIADGQMGMMGTSGFLAETSPSPEFQRRFANILEQTLGSEAGANLAARVTASATPTIEFGTGNRVSRVGTVTERTLVIPIGQMILEARKAGAGVQQQLAGDVAVLDRYNAAATESNTPILAVLTSATGRDFGNDPDAWGRWWSEQQGYAFRSDQTPRPTVFEDFTQRPTPVPVGVIERPLFQVFQRFSSSCFAAGTPVRTRRGLQSIESLSIGDEVLVQDVNSGKLEYQPILVVLHNPPDQTLRIDLGDDAITATPIHRFWRTGVGWVMARDLKPGMSIRVIGGAKFVEAIDSAGIQPVFNLEVASGASFFVGTSGVLVHDHTVVDPVEQPFDAMNAVAVANQP